VTICNVCRVDLGPKAPPHAFLCAKHVDLVPPPLAKEYIEACKQVMAARRAIGSVPDMFFSRMTRAYAAARDAARQAASSNS
jgi:hypothetical protein